MSKMDDLIELNIAEDIKAIVNKEITIIKNKDLLEPIDIQKLEKLAKTYATMMADLRENLKAGLYGKLTEDSLLMGEKNTNGLNNGGAPDKDSKKPLSKKTKS